MPNFVVLDCESTGLKKPMGAVEIAWIVIDEHMEVLGEHRYLTDPGLPIEAGAEAIHGISAAQLVGKPSNEQVLELLPKPTVVIGHNCSYDIGVMGEHMHIAETLCTLALARRWVKGTTNHKLATLQTELYLTKQQSHSALGDCRTTLELLRVISALSGRSLTELIALEREPKMLNIMPFGKHKGKLMTQIPAPYRAWLSDQTDLPKDLRYTLKRLAPV